MGSRAEEQNNAAGNAILGLLLEDPDGAKGSEHADGSPRLPAWLYIEAFGYLADALSRPVTRPCAGLDQAGCEHRKVQGHRMFTYDFYIFRMMITSP